MNNLLIRQEAKRLSIPMWKIAEILGISENTLFRRFRHELPIDEQKSIVAQIRAFKENRPNPNGGKEADNAGRK